MKYESFYLLVWEFEGKIGKLEIIQFTPFNDSWIFAIYVKSFNWRIRILELIVNVEILNKFWKLTGVPNC